MILRPLSFISERDPEGGFKMRLTFISYVRSLAYVGTGNGQLNVLLVLCISALFSSLL